MRDFRYSSCVRSLFEFHRSVLGPILFIIYINNIDVGLIAFLAKFADDTEIGNSSISDRDRLSKTPGRQGWDKGGKFLLINVKRCRILQWEQETRILLAI